MMKLSAVYCYCLHGIRSINDSDEMLELVHHAYIWRETYKGVLCQTYCITLNVISAPKNPILL